MNGNRQEWREQDKNERSEGRGAGEDMGFLNLFAGDGWRVAGVPMDRWIDGAMDGDEAGVLSVEEGST